MNYSKRAENLLILGLAVFAVIFLLGIGLIFYTILEANMYESHLDLLCGSIFPSILLYIFLFFLNEIKGEIKKSSVFLLFLFVSITILITDSPYIKLVNTIIYFCVAGIYVVDTIKEKNKEDRKHIFI